MHEEQLALIGTNNHPLKCVRYKEFETADLIGFPLLDSMQSNHVSPAEPLVPPAQAKPAKRDERLWGREWSWARLSR